jgi:hypothetical protein
MPERISVTSTGSTEATKSPSRFAARSARGWSAKTRTPERSAAVLHETLVTGLAEIFEGPAVNSRIGGLFEIDAAGVEQTRLQHRRDSTCVGRAVEGHSLRQCSGRCSQIFRPTKCTPY